MEQLSKTEIIDIYNKIVNDYKELNIRYQLLITKLTKNVSLNVFIKNISNSDLQYINIDEIEYKLTWKELGQKVNYDISKIKKINGVHYKNILNKFIETNNTSNVSICYSKKDIYYKYINKIELTKKLEQIDVINDEIRDVINDEVNIFNELTYEELLENLNFSYIEVIKMGNTNLLNQLKLIELVNYQGQKIKVSTLYDYYKYLYPLDNEEFKPYKLKNYMNKINEKWIESEICHEIVLYRKLRSGDIRYRYTKGVYTI